MSTIAIVGPGAIGGTVAAWLCQAARHDVVVCARTAFEEILLETPEQKFTARPTVLTSPAAGHAADWILVATKAYDASAAAAWFTPLTGPSTRLAVLQNGVEHIERFAPHFDPKRILPVVVDLPAERTSAGRIRQRRTGRMTVPATTDGADFRALFDATRIEVVTTDDFLTAAWTKLCINSAGAVDALALKPARVAQIAEAAELMRGIVRECIQVGRAEGARLDDSIAETVLEGYRKAPPDSVNSLLADRLARRPMEIEARNGVIVRRGQRHGIATPLNQTVVALLKAVEAP
ncbi:2-dehydropantoate 2-reductase [Opitutaceae bacterium EW11]|nr:2-dehydropantoate 2-reductase [Opitutaceae bacterium EW11]